MKNSKKGLFPMITRITAIFLMTVMLFSVVACTKNPDTDPKDSSGESSSADITPESSGEVTVSTEGTTSKYDVTDGLPSDLKYTGETIRILSRNRNWFEDEIDIADGYNGDLIDEAVYQRTRRVEDRLGIKIENVPANEGTDSYAIPDSLKKALNDGMTDYDLVNTTMYATFLSVPQGILRDVASISTLDLSKPWWHQGFNEEASFHGRQFLISGAANLSSIRFLFATFVNHQNLIDHNMDIQTLYNAVNNKQWTLDYQAQLAQQLYDDNDGVPSKSEGDTFGFVTNCDQIGVDAYWSSCKLKILSKNADGDYQWAVDVARLDKAVGKINALVWGDSSWPVKKGSSDGEQQDIAKMFVEGRAAMATLRVFETESAVFREADKDFEYSILPIPMLDEDQKEYYSYAHDQFTAFGIPAPVKKDRLEMIGATLTVFGAESYRTVMPAFYETALKGRYLKNPESAAMMDIIYDSFYMDAGVLYTKAIESVHQKLRTLIGTQSSSTVTVFRPLKRTTEVSIKKLNNNLRDLCGLPKLK